MIGNFLKGLFTGSFLAAVLSGNRRMVPLKKIMATRRLKSKTKALQTKANKFVKDLMKDVNDLLK